MVKAVIIFLVSCIAIIGITYFGYAKKEPKECPTQIISNNNSKNEKSVSQIQEPKQDLGNLQYLTAYECEQELELWVKEWKNKATPELIEQHKSFLENSPNDIETNFSLARIYSCYSDKLDLADFHFSRVLEICPSHAKGKVIQYWRKQYQEYKDRSAMENEVKEAYRKILEGGNNAQEYLKIARIYRKQRTETAFFYYKKAVELAQTDVNLLVEAGTFFKDDYYNEALNCFRKILELEPGHTQKIEIMGYIKALEEKVEKQRCLYEKGTFAEKDILASLETQLLDNSIIQKKFAIERLSQIKSNDAVSLLGKYIQDDRNKEAKREAISALCKIGTEDAKKILEKILYENYENPLKIDVLMAYLQYGNKNDVEVLEKWVTHDSSKKYKSHGEWVIKEMQKK